MKTLKTHALHALYTLTLLATLAGCKTDAQAVRPATVSPAAKTAIETTLAAYEQLRADLAADKLDAVTRHAVAIAAAAREAVGKADKSLSAHLTGVAEAAGSLAGTPADKPDAVRRQFGEISRPLVALLVSDAALRAGRHLFECPMAQGYQRWVQVSDQIANPYMGKRMPRCGTTARWEP